MQKKAKARKSTKSVQSSIETRKEKNKLSAAKSRENKKAYIHEMQKRIFELEEENKLLSQQLLLFQQPFPIIHETPNINPDDLFNPEFLDFE